MDQFISQHPHLLYVVVIILGLMVAWFIRQWFQGNLKALAEITASVADLYARYNNHETRLSHLEGEHKVFSQIKGHGET